MVARLEAQLQRMASKRASLTPSPLKTPASFPPRPGWSSSPRDEQQDKNLETIAQLHQMNHQLMVQLAAASQLVTPAVGAADSARSGAPAILGSIPARQHINRSRETRQGLASPGESLLGRI
jgi:hypothetical protein